jgi:N-methylhydantoinase B
MGEIVEKKIDHYMMIVLSKRIEAISREMTNTTLRSARSGVINVARDFSCSIVTGDGRLLFVSEGLPVHIANSDFVVQNLLELFKGDIHEGDDFLCNSPYYGNTHHADHTHIVPVFYDGEIMFFTVVRGHQADIGNTIPTTYMPYAKDLYEEGAIDWPMVRVQRNYKDIEDVVRIGKMRIRVPEQWYGDYLAQVGACRVGERRLKEFCSKYGKDYVKAFIEAYMDYGEAAIVAEIKKLKKMHLEYETKHDPVPGVADDGIPVKIKIDIDPDAGYIHIDVTDNPDSVPGGMNLCMATTRASATQGILANLDPEIPHNAGTFRRLPVKMAKNKVVGYSGHPRSMSVATTNVADRLANASGAVFAQAGPEEGIAESGVHMSPALSVISGYDWRRGDAPYCNQLIAGNSGGGAVQGHDGWLTLLAPVSSGIMYKDSIELDEQKYPIMFKCRYNKVDGGGPGKWRGAPGRYIEFLQRGKDPGTWSYMNDGHFNAAKGIHGGSCGKPADVWKYSISGFSALWDCDKDKERGRIDLPQISVITLQPGTEVLVSEGAGGGGFGDPLERDPEKVRLDAREGYISLDAARNLYGVVLDTKPELYRVDYGATEKLRHELLEKREEAQ